MSRGITRSIVILWAVCALALLVSPAWAHQASSAAAEPQPPVTEQEQEAVVDRVAVLLAERYVFEDKGVFPFWGAPFFFWKVYSIILYCYEEDQDVI